MCERASRLTDKYIIVMLLVFPLWTGPSGYADLTRSKYLFFVSLTCLWLISIIAALILERPRLRLSKLCKPSVGQWAALLFMLAALVSTLFSDYRREAIIGASRYDGLVTLLLYGLVFLGVSAFARPRRRYVYALAVSATLCSIIAVLQLSKYNPLWLFPEGYDYYDSGIKYSGAFLGTLGNTNVLAAFYSLSVPLFVCTAALSKTRRDALLLIPAVLGAYVLLRSGVASGAVALLGAATLSLPFIVALRFERKRLTRAVIVIEAALAVFCLAAVYFHPPESGTLRELSEVMHGRVDESFGSSRILIWRDSLALVREHPLTGGGPDTLALRSELGFSRFVPETGQTLSNRVDNAHNEYLNYLVNIGIFGLLPYLALAVRSVALSVKERLRPGFPVLGSALIGYFIQSFFGLGLCLIVPLVWIFMGLLSSKQEVSPFEQ